MNRVVVLLMFRPMLRHAYQRHRSAISAAERHRSWCHSEQTHESPGDPPRSPVEPHRYRYTTILTPARSVLAPRVRNARRRH